jgi:hypothetical protein
VVSRSIQHRGCQLDSEAPRILQHFGVFLEQMRARLGDFLANLSGSQTDTSGLFYCPLGLLDRSFARASNRFIYE